MTSQMKMMKNTLTMVRKKKSQLLNTVKHYQPTTMSHI